MEHAKICTMVILRWRTDSIGSIQILACLTMPSRWTTILLNMCPSLPHFTFRCGATWSQVGRLAFPRTCTRAGCQTSLGGRALRAGEWALNLSQFPFLILSPPQVFNSSWRLPNQLRLNGSGPVNLPPADVQPSPSELHLHLHQLRRLVWIRQIFWQIFLPPFYWFDPAGMTLELETMKMPSSYKETTK